MRDILLSGTAGFLASCAGAFAVHHELWRQADQQAKQLDQIANLPQTTPATAARQPTESFERFIVRRFSQWWNSGVDNVHRRLLGLPTTVEKIVDDVKDVTTSSSTENNQHS